MAIRGLAAAWMLLSMLGSEGVKEIANLCIFLV